MTYKPGVFTGASLAAAIAFLSACPAHATPPTQSAVTLYQGRGVDTNLVDLLPNIVKGDLHFDDTYFTGLEYFHPLPTPGLLQDLFDFLRIPNTKTGVAAVVLKHYGLQHNWEADLAYTLRFGELKISEVTLRFGLGVGLSYAFGTPTYEDGPRNNPEKRYRFQNYEAYEIEWGLASTPQLGLVTGVHHRSGVYGLIAPQRVGSNFLVLGLRYSF